jgi:hypothetical protein
LWAFHLHGVTQALGEAAAPESYVAIDAGVFYPSRKENYDLMLTSQWCVAGAQGPGESPVRIAEQAQRWDKLASGGRLGTLSAEIDAVEGLSAASKTLMRLHMLLVAGASFEVREALEAQSELTASLDPTSALKVAALAVECEANAKKRAWRDILDIVSKCSVAIHNHFGVLCAH